MNEFQELYKLVLDDKATADQHAHFLNLLVKPENEQAARQMLLELSNKINDSEPGLSVAPDEGRLALIKESIFLAGKALAARAAITPVRRSHFLRSTWFRYAAAIVIIFGSIAYFQITNKKTDQSVVNGNKPLQKDIASGSNKATLTLADGSTIELDNAGNGTLAQQGNASIVKLTDGRIAYKLKGLPERELMNTMSTPRGGQFELVLPDGSKVWLNAASSITYPTVFIGKERKVKIIGEVYLEVSKDKERPFIVDADGKASIEVLGTSFNVNSYSNEENIKTTLLEGSVKVFANNKSAVLKPGQQAQIPQHANARPGHQLSVVDNVNVEQVVAWRNGFFNIQDASLQEVARQLERWYDIQVKYEGNPPHKNFEGELGRNVHLSTVLNWFSDLGIHNRLEGRILVLSEH